MTCIAGIAQDGKVWIGADSAAAGEWDIRVTALRKVFRRKQFLVGYTTSFRMGQLLQYRLDVREQESSKEDLEYLVLDFIPQVRECLKSGGFMKIESNKEAGGIFLLGYRGKLYKVHSNFQVNCFIDNDGMAAIGCGDDYALGAMAALDELPPKERILRALEISARFSNGVRGPFYVESIQEAE